MSTAPAAIFALVTELTPNLASDTEAFPNFALVTALLAIFEVATEVR